MGRKKKIKNAISDVMEVLNKHDLKCFEVLGVLELVKHDVFTESKRAQEAEMFKDLFGFDMED